MGYRKKFEDSYLDDESEEFDGNDTTDAERYIKILSKEVKTGEDLDRMERLKERMFLQAKLPGVPGSIAKDGIIKVSHALIEVGKRADGIDLLTKLSDLATEIGDRDLYYLALDSMGDDG